MVTALASDVEEPQLPAHPRIASPAVSDREIVIGEGPTAANALNLVKSAQATEPL